ncbi:MAG: class I SAM-dependent methyltransferase [Hyphomonadaceae bacterium]
MPEPVKAHASRQLQTRGSTSYNRYPKTFAAAAELTKRACGNGARVLSFGCSIGEECVALAELHFTNANDRIFGVDVDARAIDQARASRAHDRVTYFASGDSGLDVAGPFDAIFAMSVLCVWPETRDLADISSIFPYERFLATCHELDLRLKIGGLLVIHNANYRFLQTPLKRRYEAVSMPHRETILVHQFHRQGHKLAKRSNQRVFRKLQQAASS